MQQGSNYVCVCTYKYMPEEIGHSDYITEALFIVFLMTQSKNLKLLQIDYNLYSKKTYLETILHG